MSGVASRASSSSAVAAMPAVALWREASRAASAEVLGAGGEVVTGRGRVQVTTVLSQDQRMLPAAQARTQGRISGTAMQPTGSPGNICIREASKHAGGDGGVKQYVPVSPVGSTRTA